MAGEPQREGEHGRSWGHSLIAVVGLFDRLVWECEHCGAIRIEKDFYRDVDCADGDAS